MRLNHRQTISHVQDNYDGAIPTNNIQDVAIESDSIELMWKIFDYGAISTTQQDLRCPVSVLQSPQDLDTTHTQSPNRPQQLESRVSRGVGGDAATTMRDIDDWPVTLTLSEQPPTSVDGSNPNGQSQSQTSQHLDYYDFGHEAFAEDWSLFGRPWAAYFPPDSFENSQ